MAVGVFIEEKENIRFSFNNHQGCLHGKLYKRSFLKENIIRFNDTRSSEDNSFNQLVLLANPKICYCNNYIYCYKENKSSITRKDPSYKFDSIKWYIDNMLWAINIGEEKKCSKILIARLVVSSLGYVYYSYCNNEEIENINQVLIWAKELVEKYDKYDVYLQKYQKKAILKEYNVSVFDSISFQEFINLVKNN